MSRSHDRGSPARLVMQWAGGNHGPGWRHRLSDVSVGPEPGGSVGDPFALQSHGAGPHARRKTVRVGGRGARSDYALPGMGPPGRRGPYVAKRLRDGTLLSDLAKLSALRRAALAFAGRPY